MTYMSEDRTQKWVTRIYDWEMLPANAGVNYFVDWDDFRCKGFPFTVVRTYSK